MHPSELSTDHLLAQCDRRNQRRSGPGGQHRNKVETAVLLTHRPSGVRAEASERRSQGENLRVAVRRLRINLALTVRSQPRDGSRPSARWRDRVAGGTIAIGTRHDDFAPLLAEALDVLEAHQWDMPPAAQHLAVTASQLVRLLKREPRALEQVNRHRASRGLHRLR